MTGAWAKGKTRQSINIIVNRKRRECAQRALARELGYAPARAREQTSPIRRALLAIAAKHNGQLPWNDSWKTIVVSQTTTEAELATQASPIRNGTPEVRGMESELPPTGGVPLPPCWEVGTGTPKMVQATANDLVVAQGVERMVRWGKRSGGAVRCRRAVELLRLLTAGHSLRELSRHPCRYGRFPQYPVQGHWHAAMMIWGASKRLLGWGIGTRDAQRVAGWWGLEGCG